MEEVRFKSCETFFAQTGGVVLSLKGPLHAKKGYLKTILEPHGISLQNVVGKASEENPAYYEFIWRTRSNNPKYEVLEEVIEGHLDRYTVRVEPSTIRMDKFTKVRGRSATYVFQHRAIVEFTIQV